MPDQVVTTMIQSKDLRPRMVAMVDGRWREIIETGENVYDYPEAVEVPKVDNRYIPLVATHDRRLWGKTENGRFPQPDPEQPVRVYVLNALELTEVQVKKPSDPEWTWELGL